MIKYTQEEIRFPMDGKMERMFIWEAAMNNFIGKSSDIKRNGLKF